MKKPYTAQQLKEFQARLDERYESVEEHHPKSIELFAKLEQLDFEIQDDALCLKSGGDGDNGEMLMCLLDIIFEHEAKTTDA